LVKQLKLVPWCTGLCISGINVCFYINPKDYLTSETGYMFLK